jgi:hypothetical protein
MLYQLSHVRMLLTGSLRLAPRISPATLGTVADLGADANSNPPNAPPPGAGGDWRHARAGGVAAGDPARVPDPGGHRGPIGGDAGSAR